MRSGGCDVRWTTWLWAHLLSVLDSLLGTRLVEREMARRQAKIAWLVTQMSQLNRDLDALAQVISLYWLTQCLVGLKARSKRDDLDDWLCFAPQDDEALLDSAIEHLVRPGLAAIDDEPAGSDNYIYRLYPDWAAIVARLESTTVASELMPWLEEQSHRI